MPAALSPPADLTEVYRVCLDLQSFASKLGVASLSAPQAGVPWRLYVAVEDGVWRYRLNPGYEPAGPERRQALVRFVNAETGSPRYYLVNAFATVRGWWQELVATAGPLGLVPHESVGAHLGLQNEVDILAGQPPPERGSECRVRRV
jgi:hypothetical protein